MWVFSIKKVFSSGSKRSLGAGGYSGEGCEEQVGDAAVDQVRRLPATGPRVAATGRKAWTS